MTPLLVKESLKNFWSNLGLGLAVLILTPLVAILLMFSIVGISVAGLLSLIYVLILALTAPLASIACGALIMKAAQKKKEYPIGWEAVVIGVIVLKIAGLIPVLGWLAVFAFVLISLGGLSRIIHQKLILAK